MLDVSYAHTSMAFLPPSPTPCETWGRKPWAAYAPCSAETRNEQLLGGDSLTASSNHATCSCREARSPACKLFIAKQMAFATRSLTADLVATHGTMASGQAPRGRACVGGALVVRDSTGSNKAAGQRVPADDNFAEMGQI